VLGAPDELIKIVLAGLKGPIEVSGKTYDQEMPPSDYLSDREIADVLTYVRSSWGNSAPPVTVKKVSTVRAKVKPAVPR
jgi:mono/diheme cytochrome c family protein